MPKGRYRYDDNHPEVAIRDLFEGNGSRGYKHPALYRLAERVVHCIVCGAGRGNPCLPARGRLGRLAPGRIMPRTRHGVSQRLTG